MQENECVKGWVIKARFYRETIFRKYAHFALCGILLVYTFKKEAKICAHVKRKNKPFRKR